MTGSLTSRRSFLLSSLGAGLTVAFLPGCSLPVIPKRPQPELDHAMGWVKYDGQHYHLTLPRLEIGQNITTALKQIACEELEVPWDSVIVHAQDTDRIGRVKSTVGSESIKDFAEPLAQACATLKDAIAEGVGQDNITPALRPGKSLKSFRSNGHYVGKSVPLEQAKMIAQGQPLYAADMRKDGMIYGRVIRAPCACDLESNPLKWDRQAASREIGFIDIIQNDKFLHGRSYGLGIMAETPGALDRIETALDIVWHMENPEIPSLEQAMDIDTRLSDGSLSHTLVDGAFDERPDWNPDIRIDIPPAAHNAIEPRAALAYEEDGRLHVWTGSQDVFYVRDVLSVRLSRDSDTICVHACRVGGGFGGKTLCFVELEAALLALASGKPVKVQWTRPQEYAQAFHRPPTSHRIRSSVTNGKVDQWHHAFSSGHILFTNAGLPEWLQKATDLIGDKGVARGATPPYEFGSTRVEYDLERLPILMGPWRGLGAAPNTMAIEIAMNETAIAAHADPVEFRLDHITDPRLATVLKSVAKQANWNSNNTLGRGIACGIYKGMSYVAVVADVELSVEGSWRVTKMWCSHDCGQIINPDQVTAQCEGNLVWGLGMVFHDQLHFGEKNVTAQFFGDAPSPRISSCPEMKIHLIESQHDPVGAGETAIVASGAAIANAIRSITGKPVNRFPIS